MKKRRMSIDAGHEFGYPQFIETPVAELSRLNHGPLESLGSSVTWRSILLFVILRVLTKSFLNLLGR